jgi:hypothetical protein
MMSASIDGGTMRLIHSKGLANVACQPMWGTHTRLTRSSVAAVHSPLTNIHKGLRERLARFSLRSPPKALD